jgi:ribonuclease HI
MKLGALPTTLQMQSTAPQNLTSQPTFIHKTDTLLQKFNSDDKIKPTPQMLNPLDYQQYNTNLSIEEIVKKSEINPSVAKQLTLKEINTKFPEPEWLRIYTDGSKITKSKSAKAGIYPKLFSQYITVGTNNSAFDEEVKAIEVALNNLSFRLKMFTKAAIVADSKAAIQAITSNQTPEDETITECRKLLKHLQKQKKSTAFQWIPSHTGIVSNAIADELAKKGTGVQTSLHSRPNLRRNVDEVKYSTMNTSEKILKQLKERHGEK